jgi:hypothetical protein
MLQQCQSDGNNYIFAIFYCPVLKNQTGPEDINVSAHFTEYVAPSF